MNSTPKSFPTINLGRVSPSKSSPFYSLKSSPLIEQTSESASPPSLSLNSEVSASGEKQEEYFEMVDYTTASHWERLTSLLEEIFSDWFKEKENLPNSPISLKEELDSQSILSEVSKTESNSKLGHLFDTNQHEKLVKYLTVDDQNYGVHYYQFHKDNSTKNPNSPNLKEKIPNIPGFATPEYETMIDGTFLPFSIPHSVLSRDLGQEDPFYLIHRWTGLTNFILLYPTSFSFNSHSNFSSYFIHEKIDPKSVNMMDQGSGPCFLPKKISPTISRSLISAGVLAFQHLDLYGVPILVPSGSSWRLLVTGYLHLPPQTWQPQASKATSGFDEELEFEIQVKVRSFHTHQVPNYLIHQSKGILQFFRENFQFMSPNSSHFLTDLARNLNDIHTTSNRLNTRSAITGYDLDGSLQGKALISAEITYSLDIPTDMGWNDVESILSPHPKPRAQYTPHIPGSFPTALSRPSSLAWGPSCDPLKAIFLLTQFPQSSHSFVDPHSPDLDFHPSQATSFSIACQFHHKHSEWALLTAVLKDAVNCWPLEQDNSFVFQMEGENPFSFTSTSRQDSSNGRDSLGLRDDPILEPASPQQYRGSILETSGHNNWNRYSMVDIDVIFSMLDGLFSSSFDIGENNPSNSKPPKPQDLPLLLQQSRAVPYQSLLYKLFYQCLASTSNASDFRSPNLRSFLKATWNQFISKIRNYWENKKMIPGIQKDDSPHDIDHRYCIIHQKLSMLNYCIYREKQYNSYRDPNKESDSKVTKSLREMALSPEAIGSNSVTNSLNENNLSMESPIHPTSVGSIEKTGPKSISIPKSKKSIPIHASASSNVSASHRDSFAAESFVNLQVPSSFDSFVSPNLNGSCSPPESLATLVHQKFSRNLAGSPDSAALVDPDVREGGLHKLDGVMLLCGTDEIWVPRTQDPGVMTEDMITEQAEIFEQMGTSEEATQIRAKMQCSQLKSDMEAFKAANPNCAIGDFLRWYSPRDWIEEPNTPGSDPKLPKGRLSVRMMEPNNIWLQIWKSCKRIPATKQKPLFDFISEGEKALHFLENLSEFEVYQHLLSMQFIIAYEVLVKSLPSDILDKFTVVKDSLTKLADTIITFPWYHTDVDITQLEPLFNQVQDAELYLGRAVSLLHKFGGRYELSNKLLTIERSIDLGSQSNSNSKSNLSSDANIRLQYIKLEEGDERSAVYQIFSQQANRWESDAALAKSMISQSPPLYQANYYDSSTIFSFPKPFKREFILQVPISLVELPNILTSPLWYRMYVEIKDSEFRMVDMIANNTAYY